MDGPDSLADILERVRNGDPAAQEAFFRHVYDELHRIARDKMARQPPGHTMQPTALVHEAFLRMQPRLGEWNDRGHFVSVAATAMRQILVDHSRRKDADKRPKDRNRVPLDDLALQYEERAIDLIQLEDALSNLEKRDPRMARLIELSFFGGQPMADCARHLGLSERQAFRLWKLARALLHRELSG